jgi:hypothetical protein
MNIHNLFAVEDSVPSHPGLLSGLQEKQIGCAAGCAKHPRKLSTLSIALNYHRVYTMARLKFLDG